MPHRLANEIAATRGPWTLSGARLRPAVRKEKTSVGVSIEMAGRHVWSEVAVSGGRQAPERAATALERSGYQILRHRSQPFFARRPLHGRGELDEEVRLLEMLATDTSSLASFPPRRRRSLPKVGSAPASLLRHLRDRHGWSLELVTASRKGAPAFVHAPGWVAGAWCWALDDGNERMLELHVQVFTRSPTREVDSDELARVTRAFRSQLAPLGYRSPDITWLEKRPRFAVFEKGLPTLAAARRERSTLDRALFGD
jgi:hypothetical protein